VSHNVPEFGIATQIGSGRLKHQFPTAFPNLRVGALKQQFPAASPELRVGGMKGFLFELLKVCIQMVEGPFNSFN
jgi:hypothetical protein